MGGSSKLGAGPILPLDIVLLILKKGCLITSQIDTAPKQISEPIDDFSCLITSQIDTAPKLSLFA